MDSRLIRRWAGGREAKIIAFAFLLAGNVEKIDFAGFGIGGWVVECENCWGEVLVGGGGGQVAKILAMCVFPVLLKKCFFKVWDAGGEGF